MNEFGITQLIFLRRLGMETERVNVLFESGNLGVRDLIRYKNSISSIDDFCNFVVNSQDWGDLENIDKIVESVEEKLFVHFYELIDQFGAIGDSNSYDVSSFEMGLDSNSYDVSSFEINPAFNPFVSPEDEDFDNISFEIDPAFNPFVSLEDEDSDESFFELDSDKEEFSQFLNNLGEDMDSVSFSIVEENPIFSGNKSDSDFIGIPLFLKEEFDSESD